MLTVAAVVDYLEQFAPSRLAESWDNVGLLLGERDMAVQRIMTCLTVTPESVAECVETGVQLLVSHHPLLFRATKTITDATPEGRMLLALIRAGTAVYSPHTAFDNTVGGINDLLAGRLGLSKIVPLRVGEEKSFKIVVFVPDKDLAAVSDALFAAGAGHIGQYRECSFRLAGTGTFFGSDATHPTIGQKGRREEVSEWRLEVICPEQQVQAVVAAMRKAHSYEEPAFDVYPLKPGRSSQGIGRVGSLQKALPLGELAVHVKTALNARAVQVVGPPERGVQRVALACGAAGELLTDAVRSQADGFLTGEMRFHDYLAAQAQGIALLLPGHFATERCGVEDLARRLQERWPEVRVWASQREADPVQWI